MTLPTSLARYVSGSVGTFEATRYGVGCSNRHAFEINGSKGMLRFNLETMNQLECHAATAAPSLQSIHNFTVTGPDHPYSEKFWKAGHIIGYEHTFIATLGDFLNALARGEPRFSDFDDAVAVQRVLDAVERSAGSQSWIKCA
jgi:predicted dehydrogenase